MARVVPGRASVVRLLLCLVVVGCGSRAIVAQEAASDDSSAPQLIPATPDGPEAKLQQAHRLSKTAKTLSEIDQVLSLCRQARQRAAGDEVRHYADQLAAWAHNRRGQLRAEQGEDAAALQDFEHALALDPDRWQALHNRAISYAQAGRWEESLADFNRALELNPNHANAYFNRGELHYDLGDFAAAIGDYDQSLRLRPSDPTTYNSRGHAYYRQGDHAAALRDFSEAIRLNPEFAAAYVNRGDAHADAGNPAQAARDYRAAIRIDPKIGRAYQSAAWLMATSPEPGLRNAELGVQAAEKAIELDGDGDPRYLDTLAAALANAGRFTEAARHQRQALEHAPEELAPQFAARLKLYENRQPFHEPPPTAAQMARRTRPSTPSATSPSTTPQPRQVAQPMPRPRQQPVQRASGQLPWARGGRSATDRTAR